MEQFKKLMEVMPKEAEQRTFKSETRRGYDTSGYGYQFCVNRFNEVYGDEWGYDFIILKETEGRYKNDTPFWDITVEVRIWIAGKKENTRACVGGHISVLYADALKGAITNAFKKTAGFWGVGRQAYEGTMDDDNTPLPVEHTQEQQSYGIALPKTEPAYSVTPNGAKAKEYCIFGKNIGKRWDSMNKAQLNWYRDNFLKNEKLSFQDAIALQTIQEILGTNINQPMEDISL